MAAADGSPLPSGYADTIAPIAPPTPPRRSEFGKATFLAAVDGRGSAHQRCNAEIALLDAVTLHGGSGAAMLRKIFGPPRQRR